MWNKRRAHRRRISASTGLRIFSASHTTPESFFLRTHTTLTSRPMVAQPARSAASQRQHHKSSASFDGRERGVSGTPAIGAAANRGWLMTAPDVPRWLLPSSARDSSRFKARCRKKEIKWFWQANASFFVVVLVNDCTNFNGFSSRRSQPIANDDTTPNPVGDVFLLIFHRLAKIIPSMVFIWWWN